MNCLFVSSCDKNLTKVELNSVYQKISQMIKTYNIKHLFWYNRKYDFYDYTCIIQMLMKDFEKGGMLFTCIIDDNAIFNDVYKSYIQFHELQLSIFLKNKSSSIFSIIDRHYDYSACFNVKICNECIELKQMVQ